jgi:hypothetical protein
LKELVSIKAMTAKTKHCYKCGKIKPVREFCNNRAKPDGLNSECKDCVASYKKCPERKAQLRERNILQVFWLRLWVKTILGGTNADSLHHKLANGTEHRKFCISNTNAAYWRSMLDGGCNPIWYAVLSEKEHHIKDAELKLKMLKSPTFKKHILAERKRCRETWIHRSKSSIERKAQHCEKRPSR